MALNVADCVSSTRISLEMDSWSVGTLALFNWPVESIDILGADTLRHVALDDCAHSHDPLKERTRPFSAVTTAI